MRCRDRTLDYLQGFGYNVIRLPKADVKPLQLYAVNGGSLDRLGKVTTVFESGRSISLPQVSEGVEAANMSGQRTSELDASLGVDLLGSVIGAMGGSELGLELQYKSAKTVVFQFGTVTEDSIEVAAVDQYLTDAEVSPFSTHVSRLLDADDVYITTGVLFATTLIVAITASRSGGAELKVPVIQELVGANVKVSGSATSASTVTYEGRVPLAFGFKAARLIYDEGKYHAMGKLPPKVTMRDPDGEPQVDTGMLLSPSGFVRLRT